MGRWKKNRKKERKKEGRKEGKKEGKQEGGEGKECSNGLVEDVRR